MLQKAVENGHERLVRILLEGGKDATLQTIDGDNLLSIAIKAGHPIPTTVKIFQHLIKFGADVNKKDKHGRTPLMSAVCVDEPSTYVMSMLLENGADLFQKDQYGFTALQYARKAKQFEIFEYLRENMLAARQYKTQKPRRFRFFSIPFTKRKTSDKGDLKNQGFDDIFKDELDYEGYDDQFVEPKTRSRANTYVVSSYRHRNGESFLPGINSTHRGTTYTRVREDRNREGTIWQGRERREITSDPEFYFANP